jgi:hypothetical protein
VQKQIVLIKMDYEDNFQVQTLGTESHTYHICTLYLTNVINKPSHKLHAASRFRDGQQPSHDGRKKAVCLYVFLGGNSHS